MRTKNLFKKIFQYKETCCTIISDSERAIWRAITSIKHNRKDLEEYIIAHDLFLCSLRPVAVADGPKVVKLMAEAAAKANVGPMAAVAGVLADLAVKEMVLDGCGVAVVENGGEISASSDTSIDVALSAGDSLLSKTFGFRLSSFPIGIATSSGLYSHALSFGEAEAATVFSSNAGLADAAATSVANLVKGEDCSAAINRATERALHIPEIEGVLIIYRGIVGLAGRVPQIIKLTAECSGGHNP
jgi:ApbE superfamily uncharacterized protein (UPF0280 family)